MTINNIPLVSTTHNRLKMLLWRIIGCKRLTKIKAKNKFIQVKKIKIKSKKYLLNKNKIQCSQTLIILREIKGNKQSQIKRFKKVLKVIKKKSLMKIKK